MRVLGRWEDGFRLETDPRRGDPLVYYLRGDDWVGAVGLEILPLYREAEVSRVEISVFEEHRELEAALSDAERERLYVRCLPALAAEYGNWKQIGLKTAGVDRILASGALDAALGKLGFRSIPVRRGGEARWSRF